MHGRQIAGNPELNDDQQQDVKALGIASIQERRCSILRRDQGNQLSADVPIAFVVLQPLRHPQCHTCFKGSRLYTT